MLYSDYLKTPEIANAMVKAGVANIQSPILDGKEDFHIPPEHLKPELKSRIIDNEIIYRRKYADYLKAMADHDERMKPYKKQEEKINFAKPFVEKIVSGRMAEAYESLEIGMITVIAERVAKKYEYEMNGEVKTEDYSGLSELQKVLKKSSITHISPQMSLEEIVLREIFDSGYAKMLK